ncbi:GH36-type glycosyl hydrolase domain-containing protein [Caballeronia sp. LjRoot31]|uniref:GH36-type glycosyl hydrolase domain-containing protein n=1 Tax=Caballeronia sp. LjRoot31 TaxID=3342324 RepID=UPI003ED111FD
MNRVGAQGCGEGVWLGFFLHDVLLRFAETARAHNDTGFASRCPGHATVLRTNLEAHGGDGEWYRRAWAARQGRPLERHAAAAGQLGVV